MRTFIVFVLATASLPSLAYAQDPISLREERIVVELYTSQGCSSCPPADKYLSELIQNEQVLGLGLHVTYWDRLGWVDPLGIEGFSNRQAATNARLRNRAIRVTPQMVVQGQFESSGSGGRHERMIDGAISSLREASSTPWPEVSLTQVDDQLVVQIEQADTSNHLVTHLVAFRPESTADIRRGENAGRQLTYTNSVILWASVRVNPEGQSSFDANLIERADDETLNWALIVQDGPVGEILSAREVKGL